MNKFKVLVGAAALVAASAYGAAAKIDVTKMTCADYSGFSEKEEMTAAADLLAWIQDAKNQTAAGELVAKYGTNETNGKKWRAEEMHVEIEGHCIDADPKMTVIERLKTHS